MKPAFLWITVEKSGDVGIKDNLKAPPARAFYKGGGDKDGTIPPFKFPHDVMEGGSSSLNMSLLALINHHPSHHLDEESKCKLSKQQQQQSDNQVSSNSNLFANSYKLSDLARHLDGKK